MVPADAIADYIRQTLPAAVLLTDPSGGGRFFMTDARQQFPFATLITSDRYDGASNLEARGLYRLNLGVSKTTFQSLLGEKPALADFDLTAVDTLLPHPHYAMMYWLCCVAPGEATFEKLKPMIAEAFKVSANRSGS